MTYEEKLDRIVKALKEAKKLARKDYNSKLYIDNENIKGMNLNELRDILLQLQDDEQIIKLNGIPTKLKSTFDQTDDILKGHKDYFLIDILDAFDGWYTNYLIKKKSKVENLSEDNFNNVYSTLLTIENELQIHQSNSLTITYVSSVSELEGYEKTDIDDLIDYYVKAFTYLRKIGVIKDFTSSRGSLSSEVVLDVEKFTKVLDNAKHIEQALRKKGQVSSPTKADGKPSQLNDDIVYKITYTKNREILLNETLLLAKPDFDSENDLVFKFLYDHPNEKFSPKQVGEEIQRGLTKDFHKIVENLGFTGDLKKVFFNVSKSAIQFRNPTTKKDLEQLGIERIKLPKPS